MFAGTPAWTRIFRRLLLFGIAWAILAYFLPGIFRTVGSFFPILGFAFAARQNPDLSWPGARPRTVSGSNIAMHFVYPIGFWRLTLLNLKVRLTHFGLLLTALGVVGAILLFRHDSWIDPDTGYYCGRILTLVLSLIAFAPIAQISPGTNDASRWRVIVLAPLVAAFYLGLAVTMFAVGGAWGYLAGMGLLLTSYAGLVLYGCAYNRGRFDAQRKPQTSTSFKLSRS